MIQERAQLSHGDAVTITVPWLWVEVARALAACIATGAVVGVSVVLVRMGGERRGS